MKIEISSTGRVICEATIALPMSAGTAWGQLRDFRTSATYDPFHAEIEIDGHVPRAGAKLKVVHRYLLIRTNRIGRIVWWKEGAGFAFSDLNQDDPTRAFPHILKYSLEPTTEKSCNLKIKVAGKWTAIGPQWVGRLWLWWVFSHVVRRVENQMLCFWIAMKNQKFRPAELLQQP